MNRKKALLLISALEALLLAIAVVLYTAGSINLSAFIAIVVVVGVIASAQPRQLDSEEPHPLLVRPSERGHPVCLARCYGGGSCGSSTMARPQQTRRLAGDDEPSLPQ